MRSGPHNGDVTPYARQPLVDRLTMVPVLSLDLSAKTSGGAPSREIVRPMPRTSCRPLHLELLPERPDPKCDIHANKCVIHVN
jgi:hypothetical protein